MWFIKLIFFLNSFFNSTCQFSHGWVKKLRDSHRWSGCGLSNLISRFFYSTCTASIWSWPTSSSLCSHVPSSFSTSGIFFFLANLLFDAWPMSFSLLSHVPLSSYIYMHMYEHVCVHICIYMCVYIYLAWIYFYVTSTLESRPLVSLYIHVYIYMYMYLYLYIHIHIHICVHIQMYVNIFSNHIHTGVTSPRLLIYTCIYIHVCDHVCICMYVYIHQFI